MGTGGTISGVGQVPEGEEPEGAGDRRRSGRLDPQGTTRRPGSIAEAHTYKIEGVGEDFIPERHRLLAGRLGVSPATTATVSTWRGGWRARRRSSSAARRAWPRGWRSRSRRGLTPDHLVVVLLPGHRRALPDQGAQRRVDARQPPARSRRDAGGRRAVRQERRRARGCCRCRWASRCKRALALVEQHDVSQVPVLRGRRGRRHGLRQRAAQARARRSGGARAAGRVADGGAAAGGGAATSRSSRSRGCSRRAIPPCWCASTARSSAS